MPNYSKSKYTAEQNGELTTHCIEVIENSSRALTIEEIQHSDIILSYTTPQKMSRILNHLVEMGMIKKEKSKTNGRMIYKTFSI